MNLKSLKSLKSLLPWLIPLTLGSVTLGMADWVALDASGVPITFEGQLSPSGAQLPKHVITDSTGLNVLAVNPDGSVKVDTATVSQPVTQASPWSVGLASSLPAGSNTIGTVNQAGSPWSFNLTQLNGNPPAVTNPLPAQLVQPGSGGTLAPVSGTNSLSVTCTAGCGAASATEAAPATYGVGISIVEYAATGERACLWGSATKIVRLKRFSLNAFSVTPDTSVYKLTRRSTVDTGGSPTAATLVQFDTTDPPPTATVQYFGSAPTVGTLAGDVMNFPVYGSGSTQLTEFKFGAVDRGSKSVILRSATEGICLFGLTNSGNTIYFSWEWTEE
jgi:hypothetical protein